MSDTIPPTPPDDLSGLIIETERLVLRQPTRDDAPRLAGLANNGHIAQDLTSLPHPYSLEDALVFIDNSEVKASLINLGIYLKGDGLIGIASLLPRDGDRMLGYWIGEPFWGRGLATEAAQAMVDLAFERLDAPFVAAAARVTNAASRRVLEKSGFQYAGQGMAPSLFFRGMVPVDRFRIDHSVWRSLKGWRAARIGETLALEAPL